MKNIFRNYFLFSAFFFVFSLFVFAQSFQEQHQKLLTALENRDFETAWSELRQIRRNNKKVFEYNNYDYLQGRLAEKRNDLATASASFQNVVKRGSVLREYALWHLSQIARRTGNLMQERMYLQQIQTIAPESFLREAVLRRMLESLFESGEFGRISDCGTRLKECFGGEISAKTSEQATGDDFKNPKFREFITLVGQAQLRNGKKAEARDIFTKIINNTANPGQPDDFSLAAVRGLDEMDSLKPEDFGKIAPPIAENEHFKRAFIYQFNRDFKDSRLHYEMLVNRYPQGANTPDALLQLGRSYILENRPDEALKYYDRLLSTFPEHPTARDALNFKASALARMKRSNDAINAYKQFISKYIEEDLTQDNAERPFLNIVDALRDDNKIDEAFAFAGEIREKFRGKLAATLAAFAQARIRLARNDWQGALNVLEVLKNEADLGGTRVPGGTNKNEVLFLYAYALEKLSRFEEAVNFYLEIPDGRNEFYGRLATERLKALATNEAIKPIIDARITLYRNSAVQSLEKDAERARKSAQIVLRLTNSAEIRREMLEVARKSYEKLPAYRQVPTGNLLKLGRQTVRTEKPKPQGDKSLQAEIADELLFLGLYDEGTPIFEKTESGKRKPESANVSQTGETIQNPKSKIQNLSDERFTLATFYKRGDLAHRSIAIVEPFWRSVPADYLIELAPREAVELLYPTPYLESLLKIAPAKNIDPRFILSIMRQESRFNTGVKSNAAARGLMQFIAPTANEIARQLNIEKFNQNELYNPPTAILFGAQYLANLYKMFPNKHAAVAASYNGGEFNMEKWLARSHSEEQDRYTAEIQFTQSKDYVYKVMANFRTYQILYDENLKRR